MKCQVDVVISFLHHPLDGLDKAFTLAIGLGKSRTGCGLFDSPLPREPPELLAVKWHIVTHELFWNVMTPNDLSSS